MSEEQNKVNVLYNEIRSIIKLPDEKERHDKIRDVLSTMSSAGVSAVSNSADPQLAVSVHFGSFSAIGMMLGAIEIDKDNVASVINYVQTVVGMAAHILINAEEGKDGAEA